jgi:hypothetical protein
MNRRIGPVVFVALCAVAFGAATASGASAAIGPYTAYTCYEEGTGKTFSNSHCSSIEGTAEQKKWKHVAIPAGQTTQLTTEQLGVAKLTTRIGLANVVIEWTASDCEGCHFKNVHEAPGAGKIEATGGHLRLTNAKINAKSCKVTGAQVTTEPLEVEVTSMESVDPDAFYVTDVKPVTPGTVAVVNLENNGTETCVFGPTITVTGFASGKMKGSTIRFTTGANELKVGAEEVKLTGELELKGGNTPTVGEPNPPHEPIALTTGE